MREGGAHSPSACKPGTLGDQGDWKAGLIEEAFGALDTQRLGDLQRRRMKVFGKEPRQVPRPDPKALRQRINRTPVQSASLDQNQSTFYGCLGTLPCRTEWGGLRPAAEAEAVAGAFGRCCARIELDIAHRWRTHPANGATINARRLDSDENHAIEGRIAAP